MKRNYTFFVFLGILALRGLSVDDGVARPFLVIAPEIVPVQILGHAQWRGEVLEQGAAAVVGEKLFLAKECFDLR